MPRHRAVQAEDKQERRQALLDAARRLLARRAERLPAVSEVADEAGLAKGTVYLYFASKEELFLALHEDAVTAYFDELTAMLERDVDVGFADVFRVTRRHVVDAPLFLPLGCRVFAMLQDEIRASVARGFRLRLGERLMRAGARVEQRFGLRTEEGVALLRNSYALIIGLWQLSAARGNGVTPADVVPASGALGAFEWDYAHELERALASLWNGQVGARAAR
jgi:AcrR family transcriptional regulator